MNTRKEVNALYMRYESLREFFVVYLQQYPSLKARTSRAARADVAVNAHTFAKIPHREAVNVYYIITKTKQSLDASHMTHEKICKLKNIVSYMESLEQYIKMLTHT